MAMMRRIFAMAGLMLATLLLQGCPKGVAINVFNNSNEGLSVLVQNNEQLKWGAGTSLSFKSGERSLKAARDVRGQIVPLLSVRKGAKLLSYQLSFYGLPDEYIGHSSGTAFTSGTLEYSLQLEPDENLYVVRPGSSLPARGLVPQPPGFPIKPETGIE